jgi:hypothetical protein
MTKKIVPTKDLFHDICHHIVQKLSEQRRVVTETTAQGKDILMMHPTIEAVSGLTFPLMTQFHQNDHELFTSASLQYSKDGKTHSFRITSTHGEVRISEMNFMIPEPFLRFSETQLNAGTMPQLYFWPELPAISLPDDFLSTLLIEKSHFPVIKRILLLLSKMKAHHIVKNFSWIGKQVRDILEVDPISRNQLFTAYEPFDFMKSAEVPRHVLTLFLAGGIPLETIRDLQSK